MKNNLWVVLGVAIMIISAGSIIYSTRRPSIVPPINQTKLLMNVYGNVTQAVLIFCRVELTPTGPIIRNSSVAAYTEATAYWGFYDNGTCVIITVPYMTIGWNATTNSNTARVFNDVFGYRYGNLDTFIGGVKWNDLIVSYNNPKGNMLSVPKLSSYNQTNTLKVLRELHK
jgi:hypothetical protein